MNSGHNLFKERVEQILTETQSVRLAKNNDEENVHHILESVSMKLSDGLELIYSRRPNLLASYKESLLEPLIFVDQNAGTSTATISQTHYYVKGQKVETYYSSDLRMSEKTPLAVKKDFASLYPQFVKSVPEGSLFITAVLKENIRAMKLFAKLSKDLSYNPLFEMVTRTLVLLPFSFKKPSLSSAFSIEPANLHVKEVENFLNKKIQEAQFCPDLHQARKRLEVNSEFVVLNSTKEVVGYFSLYRSKERKILVKAKSPALKFLLFMVGLISGSDLTQKIPWLYVNTLVVNSELIKSQILCQIIHYLITHKIAKTCELLSFTHLINQDYEGRGKKKFLGLPQINTETVVFQVEAKPESRLINQDVIIDATLL